MLQWLKQFRDLSIVSVPSQGFPLCLGGPAAYTTRDRHPVAGVAIHGVGVFDRSFDAVVV